MIAGNFVGGKTTTTTTKNKPKKQLEKLHQLEEFQ